MNKNTFEGLSDSVIILESKPRRIVTTLISLIVLIVLLFIIWASVSKKDIYVSSYGSIQSRQNVSSILSINGGKIKKLYVTNYQNVQKGDILFEYDGNVLQQQLAIYNSNLATNKEKIEKYNRVKKDIDNNRNSFDNSDPFHTVSEKYLSDLAIASKSESESKIEIDQSIQDVEIQISNLNRDNNKIGESIDIYNQYKDSLNNEVDMFIVKKGQYYDEYVQLLQNIKNSSIEIANELKDNKLKEIENELADLNADLNANNSVKDLYEQKIINYSNKGNNSGLTQNNLKQQIILEIDSKIETFTNLILETELKIIEIDNNINETIVYANVNGTVVIESSITEGIHINPTGEVLKIVPDNDELIFITNILESDIHSFNQDDLVDIKLNAFPYSTFGKLKGKVINISPTPQIDEKNGTVFYIAEIMIERTSYDKIKENDLKQGMLGELTNITESKSVLQWLLEELNLWLNE